MGSLNRIFACGTNDNTPSAGPAAVDAALREFATCACKVAPGGCARCKRMLQLFRLHASVCDRPEQDQPCRVPLCR